MDRPLSNLRILDLSWVLSGPFGTRLLADFGAEVIKVQPPLAGQEDKFSQSYYDSWNRNKLGITLDLSKSEGLALVRKLVGISDALVENFSPRVLANWGLEYPQLQLIRPDIILLSLSAMGNNGPWKDFVAFGPTIQAFSGFTALTAYPGGSPLGVGYSISDHIAGLYGSLALLAALECRRQTGRGQYIDLSQLETMAGFLSEAFFDYGSRAEKKLGGGEHGRAAAPEGVYPCLGLDRWCAISVTGDDEWAGFKAALAHPSWAEQPAFSTYQKRRQNQVVLDDLISGWTRERAAETVMSVLQKAGVAAGVVQNAADLAHDLQLASRGFFVDVETPSGKKSISDREPLAVGGSRMKYQFAPAGGHDNNYVYGQLLGMSAAEIERLQAAGVI
jgi:crotonobetainyl-CoA:carnitine CoA-transferase CaiB-like acyl-CoA transferase